jgi:hypothetical protein
MAEVQRFKVQRFRQLPIEFCEKSATNFLQSSISIFQKRLPIVLKRVKFFATCLVSAQSLGFMGHIKEIFLIPQFLNP